MDLSASTDAPLPHGPPLRQFVLVVCDWRVCVPYYAYLSRLIRCSLREGYFRIRLSTAHFELRSTSRMPTKLRKRVFITNVKMERQHVVFTRTSSCWTSSYYPDHRSFDYIDFDGVVVLAFRNIRFSGRNGYRFAYIRTRQRCFVAVFLFKFFF